MRRVGLVYKLGTMFVGVVKSEGCWRMEIGGKEVVVFDNEE